MSIKILLADDSITIQKVIGIIFGGEDYSLTVVDNGTNAVDKAREITPDILLIDAIMPGMSGYEVCKAIRAIPALETKPILMLIGSFEPFDEEKAKSCGADDFIAKPFESQQIISKVKELCESGVARASQLPAVEPIFEPPAAAPAEPPVVTTTETTPTDDIWGAFTPTLEPEPADELSPETIADSIMEPDVFAITEEMPDDTFEQPAFSAPSATAETAESQWSTVGEQNFGFEDDAAAEPPANASSDSVPAFDASAFDFSYTENNPISAEPAVSSTNPAPIAFEEGFSSFVETTVSPAPTATTFAEPAATFTDYPPPVTVPVPDALTEEQLKAAIAGVSREVIERIVWEIVPDLAETLIKEAIRKIREGQ